jgi:hypothetical protein
VNYLQLAREVKRESGLSGGGPVSITTATGDDLRIFNWVNWAARDITLSREDWRFRRGSATLASTTSQANPASAFGLTDFASWKAENNSYKPSTYRVSDGAGMEQAMVFLSYDEFRQRFMVGQQTPSSPQYWTVSPSEDFLVGPAPDFAHFIRADYVKDYTPMALDADVPIIPARFHMLIVWRALMEYGGFDSAGEVYQRAQSNYSLGYPQLSQSQTDAPTFAARSLG